MKRKVKSALNRTGLVFFCASFLLSGCADSKGPTWLTGEPDDAILKAEPRVVGTPDGLKKQGWPNLADMPDKRPKFSKMRDRETDAADLNSDRLKAQAEMERIRNIPLYESAGESDTTPDANTFSYSALKP
jgi:hypothetical protein